MDEIEKKRYNNKSTTGMHSFEKEQICEKKTESWKKKHEEGFFLVFY